MIDQLFAFSVAASAAATNISPTNFNPTPDDGVIELFAAADPGAGTISALPSLQVVLGGSTPGVPVPGSVIPVNRANANFVGPDVLNRLMGRVPVRKGTNLQLNLSGGTGQTVTGRIRAVFMTMEEMAAHPVGLG